MWSDLLLVALASVMLLIGLASLITVSLFLFCSSEPRGP